MKKRPEDLSAEDVRSFLLHLQSRVLSIATINGYATGLRFFLRVTLGRGAGFDRVPVLRERRRLPMVLTPEEVARIIAAAPGLKYRTALSVAYDAGLRASEAASLKVSSIDSRAMGSAVERMAARGARRVAPVGAALRAAGPSVTASRSQVVLGSSQTRR